MIIELLHEFVFPTLIQLWLAVCFSVCDEKCLQRSFGVSFYGSLDLKLLGAVIVRFVPDSLLIQL